jgi:DNA-directed RNA polymerase specialized sigma24 family protein
MVAPFLSSQPDEDLELAALLTGFLAADPDARTKFPERMGGRLRATAGRIAPDLKQRDLIDDVVQQAYELLLRRPAGHFDPSRGSAAAYLHQIIRLAARDIRAQFAAPGTSTRPRRDEGGEFVPTDPPLTLDLVVGAGEEAVTMAETIVADVDVEDLVLGVFGARALLDLVPDQAPTWLREVLALVANGHTVSEAAAEVGQSRFAVRRAINHWALPQAITMRSAE